MFLVARNLLIAIAVASLAPATAMAQSSQSWEQILAAAKKEGVVSVIGPQGSETRDALTLAFQKKYPDIRVELQSMAGNQIGPKLLNELAAGRNSTDVLITGTTTALETLLPVKALVAVKPWLSGPNTQDPSKWRGGKLTFSDEAQSYNLVFSAYVKAPFIYNSNLVSGADFKSWKDLLEPKWQGKIALKDPLGAGGGLGNSTLWYSHEGLGKDFMRKMFALKDLVMPRDDRQMLDFAARGKYPIAIGPSDVLTNEFIARGLPLKHLKPDTLKEGTYITAGNGSLAIPRSAPHPNASRVYVDFLLSPEGQLEWSKAARFASLRRDVSKDHVQDILVPKEGMPYPDISTEKYVRLREEIVEFIKTIMPR
ncbi:MAG TPA: extracellular solute-binding protein [Candidatus Binatia bacterium]|jgi:iron(III) transport system substrate-binding protein|nr:extracellular solute-binding protein [Candidatus Binatia bacterium]